MAPPVQGASQRLTSPHQDSPTIFARAITLAVAFAVIGTAASAQAPATRSLQGDSRAWTQNPHLHRVWERLRVVCSQGCAKADPAAFERDALAEMRQMAPAMHMTPDAMAEHVKAIPRQLLTIGQEDPSILTDYDKFIVALVGPA